jgi:hypothetical protein
MLHENSSSESRSHWIFALLLGIAGLLILLVFINLRSQAADNGTTNVSVSGSAPSFGTIYFVTTSASATMIATAVPSQNTVTTYYLEGSYTDLNGCEDVASSTNQNGIIIASVHPTTASGLSCYTGTTTTLPIWDDTSCYGAFAAGTYDTIAESGCVITSCDNSGGVDTDANFSCKINVQYNAEQTVTGANASAVWYADIIMAGASDLTKSAASSTASFEMATVNALTLGGNVAFGSLALGGTSAEQSLTITNQGNNNSLNVAASATAMTCTQTGTIIPGYIRMSTTTGQTWAQRSWVFSSTSTPTFGISLSKATVTTTASVTTTYLNLKVPASGVAGVCNGTLTLSATT